MLRQAPLTAGLASLIARKDFSLSLSAAAVAAHWLDALAIGALVVVAAVAVAHLSRLRARLGRLHPFAIRQLLVSLYGRALPTTRAFVRQSLHVWRRVRPCRHACCKNSAVRSVRDATADRRRGRPRRPVVTWRLGRRLGGPLAGLIALLLLATCPLYYGHMFMNAKDAPFAVAMAIALLGTVRAFEEFARNTVDAGAVRCRHWACRRFAGHGRFCAV